MAYTQKRSPLKQLSGSTYGPMNKINKIATIGTPTSISTPREKEERTVISPSGSGYINASESISSQVKKQKPNNSSTSSIELPEVTDNSLKRANRKEKRAERKEDRAAYKSAYKENIEPFTAAVPVDSSFSSIMAATAQNIAKHLGSSISARKAAKKSLMAEKPSSKIEPMTTKEAPKSVAPPTEERSTISPSAKPTPTKTKPAFLPLARKESNESGSTVKIKSIGEQLGLNTSKMPKPPTDLEMETGIKPIGSQIGPKNFKQNMYPDAPWKKYAPESRAASKAMEGMQRDMRNVFTEGGTKRISSDQREIINKAGSDFDSYRSDAEKNRYDQRASQRIERETDLAKNKEEKAKSMQEKRNESIEASKKRLGINMVGDGFSKAMLRKSKYKK